MFMKKLKQLLSNKNFVTLVGAILIAIVIYVGYNMRLSSATSPVRVPYALESIDSRTEITDKMIGYTYLCDIHFITRSANLGGMIIADADYRDGTAWIETYIFVMEYAFERLNLNRLYGSYLSEHPMTGIMSDCTFFKTEGVLREAIFKNGEYHDEIINSLLSSEYFLHKQNGDYEINSIMKRLIQMIRTKK